MSAKKWVQWLSVIALVMAASSVLVNLWSFFMGEGYATFDSTELGLLLTTIVLVIIAFKKK